MSTCCAQIQDLATTIWYDIGQPTGQPPSYIQSRLVSAPYIGKLNNLLGDTCYAPVSGCISPQLGNEAQGIYELMYQYDYYTTQLNKTLAGINPGVISLQDGDSRLVFASPVDVARMYRDARASTMDELVTQVGAYRQEKSQPSSVDMPLILNGAFGGTVGPFPRGYYRS